MLIIPAVDIMDHMVVQLVGGVPGTEKITMPDPVEAALMWVSKGAKALHIIDLDGAFGKENNIPVIKEIIKRCGVPVEVGGGIKDEATIRELLDAGADKVIVGTKAIKDTKWLKDMADKFPGRLLLAMDTKRGRIAVKAWQEESQISVDDMFDIIRNMPLAGILNTNVDVEGKGKGIDEPQTKDFILRCPHPVIASGGVSTEDDARKIANAGAVAAVVGISVYTGLMEPWKWVHPWILDI
ncbi:MAG: 1-(5-phosphoribosyl)-5-[(5-phosphoribosylamino)methylideneamino] imidazole-4-carboxamide isomerase [Methanomassiliicoccaceae archaeon]|jgi:phosphoribosylformimino-5-aminoimidazole carboxamide ribotide isomerase|nr:1-(5-phosphoribosyl)-5-[(5-phosphoribosylamino)methylideneamino] imidazole-4-carboxamide isomerase [Methanomassiliicoccaceae archaeon]